MGMYDELVVKCPTCDCKVRFQSKEGDCILAEYRLDNVPDIIAMDLDGDVMFCSNCGNPVSIATESMISIMVN